MIFGTGFAPFRGGPINYSRNEGIDVIVERLTTLTEKYGDRFKPDAGWNLLK
jgi:3-hydroxyacyl-CoA dehydrogenase/enoyl-CoA hydratase/3-hydroxybutyryl-CoA epimerase